MEPEALKVMAVNFFKQLYSAQGDVKQWPLLGGFPRMLNENIESIQAVPVDSEIKAVVFAMGPLKAPGPDGLHPIFFHSHWDSVARASGLRLG